MRTLAWFRDKDLRLADHPALASAASGGEVIPLFVLDPSSFAPEPARRAPHHTQFLLESLEELASSINAAGSRLVLAAGESASVLQTLAARWKVDRVVAQVSIAPAARERDRQARAALRVPLELEGGETLAAPGSLRTKSGDPFRVFTPFSRAFARSVRVGRELAAPQRLPPLPTDVANDAPIVARAPTLGELGITRNPGLQQGGEPAARQRLARFLSGPGRSYHEQRDRLAAAGTSRLSADLKFGTLSVREVWRAAQRLAEDARRSFRNELLWREFTHGLLWDFPELMSEPFQAKFEGFPWRTDEASWQAWVTGKTGYPVVDASARQLLGEGFVHNRARMISASFLTKLLLIDYARGEAHYMLSLTDGDAAQNNAGWQWAAGSGSDAQPYFRIFNPVTQGQRFDPDGEYVRRWVPELAKLPARYIHAPWLAPPAALEAAGVRLGSDYPAPIVDHAPARARYLETAQRHFAARVGA